MRRPVVYAVIALALLGAVIAEFWFEKYRERAFFRSFMADEPFPRDYPWQRDYRINPKKWRPRNITLTPRQLAEVLQTHVLDELTQALNDERELPFVKRQLRQLYDRHIGKTVELRILAAGAPGHEGAFASSWVQRGTRYIVWNASHVTTLKELYKPEAFHDRVVESAVHETLHTDEVLQRLKTREQHVADESRVWATMVRDVIRPWYRQGRYPTSRGWKIAKFFKQCGDNPRNPRWRSFFDHFLLAAS